MNQANEKEMFQNADQIYYRNKKLKSEQISPMKGALILTYSKELATQIYIQSRLLDQSEKVRINRLTSSLQMKTPIVEFLTPEQKPGEVQTDD